VKNALGKNFKIEERKSSKFGSVGTTDRGDELSLSTPIIRNRNNDEVSMGYYNNLKRKEIYRTALDKYLHDQVARPIVNLISNAIYSEAPDFQGDEELVKRANQIVKDSEVDWSTWGVDGEVHGDVFIRSFFGKNPKIASIPAQTIDISYDEDNIIDIDAYIQNEQSSKPKVIPPKQMSHIKLNNTTNTVYGNSTLRPIFWWLDVLDNLWERNCIRAAQYYGSPIVGILGVPAEHIPAVKTELESEGQRPGKNWVFPEGVTIEVPDLTKNYPITDLIDRVYQYILSACNIPQHLIYESDSSRGVAMFSGDAFEMMIKVRQNTWGKGIVQAIKNILVDEKVWKEDSKLSLHFAPVFSRDLKELANLIDKGMTHNLYSKKSAREILRLDHTEEVANRKRQKVEEPEDVPAPIVPPKVGATPKAKPKPKVPAAS